MLTLPEKRLLTSHRNGARASPPRETDQRPNYSTCSQSAQVPLFKLYPLLTLVLPHAIPLSLFPYPSAPLPISAAILAGLYITYQVLF